MHRILHWLTGKLSRSTSVGATEEHDFDQEEYGGSEEEQPRGPAIYVEANGDTQPCLEIIKEPLRTPDMSEGFDPYNSGTFKVLKK